MFLISLPFWSFVLRSNLLRLLTCVVRATSFFVSAWTFFTLRLLGCPLLMSGTFDLCLNFCPDEPCYVRNNIS